MTPRNWRRRWFIVRDDCIAYYYHSPDVSAYTLQHMKSVNNMYMYIQCSYVYNDCDYEYCMIIAE